MSDKTILAFDTCGPWCTAAVLRHGAVVATRFEDMTRGQAERLMPLLQEVMHDAATTWRDLDAVGVGVGPGNFTGIRISVSAARGMVLGLDIPALGVSAFEVLAAEVDSPKDQTVLVSLAQRGGGNFLHHLKGLDLLGDPFLRRGDDDVVLQGSCPDRIVGADADVIAAALGLGEGTWQACPYPAQRSAALIARIAAHRLDSGAPLSDPAPLYVRAADAAPSKDAQPVILDDA